MPIKTIIERNYDLDIKNPTSKVVEEDDDSKTIVEKLNLSFNKSIFLLEELTKNK